MTDADLRAQYAFWQARARQGERGQPRRSSRIRRVKAQLDDRLKKSDDAALKTDGRHAQDERLGGRGEHLSGAEPERAGSAQLPDQGEQPAGEPALDGRARRRSPDQQHAGDLRDLVAELKGYTERLDEVWKTDLAAVNAS